MTRQDTIEQIERELTMIMGPLAGVIMKEKAAEFGKTLNDFPEHRIAELVEEISLEIHNHLKKVEFQRAALEILRESPHRPVPLTKKTVSG